MVEEGVARVDTVEERIGPLMVRTLEVTVVTMAATDPMVGMGTPLPMVPLVGGRMDPLDMIKVRSVTCTYMYNIIQNFDDSMLRSYV